MAIIHNEESLEKLYKTLAVFDDPQDIKDLLFDLCTSREVEELAQRLQVARMLNDGMSYLSIQEETGASAATVARVSKFLNKGAGGYHKALDKELDDELDEDL